MNAPTVSEPMTVPADLPAEAWSQSRAWHLLALAEARAARRQWRTWLCLGLMMLAYLAWVELLAGGILAAATIYKEMLGDEPLPALTQWYIMVARLWTGWLQGLTWLSLLAFWCCLAWPGARHHRQALADWGRLCFVMSHLPAGSPPTPTEQVAILHKLRLPAIRARVANLLWPPLLVPRQASLPAWTEPPPALAQVWDHHRGTLTPSQWAACGQQFSQALDQEDFMADLLLWLLLAFGLAMVVFTGFMVLALFMPLLKIVDCLGGC